MMEKIKPCPFCGSDNIIVVDTQASYWCKCYDCGSNGPPSINKNAAIQLWNAADNMLEAALKEGDKKNDEIDKLSDERDYWCKAWQYNHEYWQREYKNETGRKANAIAERDEARKIARYYYRRWQRVKDAFKE